MICFKLSPILLSDNISFASNKRLIYEKASLVIGCFEFTDDSVSWESHFKMNLLVNFISNVVKPFFNENNLIDVVKFCEKQFTLIVENWLKILKNLNHKVLVFKVFPRVETMLQ